MTGSMFSFAEILQSALVRVDSGGQIAVVEIIAALLASLACLSWIATIYRITFDMNLRVFSQFNKFLSLTGRSEPVFDDHFQILEVKSSIRIPAYLTSILSSIKAIRSVASKYTFGRRYSHYARWTDIHREPL